LAISGTKLVPISESGHRLGEANCRATISDAMVTRLRDLHEHEGLGYRRLAAMFKLRPNTVKRILDYRERATLPRAWKRVPINEEGKRFS
jgi:hypothetical protein